MPVAKIHVLEGRYDEARLDRVSNAVQQGLISALGIPPDDFFQPRLEHMNLAAPQRVHLGRIHIEAEHLVAYVGKAGPAHQAHIACPDHRHVHASVSPNERPQAAGFHHAACPSASRLAPQTLNFLVVGADLRTLGQAGLHLLAE